MKANSSNNSQISKAWKKPEVNKSFSQLVALVAIFFSLAMISDYHVVSAKSTQVITLRPLLSLCLNQYQIGFRKLRVGETDSKTLILENCGSGSLTIHDTTISGADSTEFSITENPAGAIIQGYEKCFIVASFQPQKMRNGERNAQLNIFTSSNTANVQMTGTAIVPDGLGVKVPPLTVPDDIPPCKPPTPYGLVCLVNQTDWSINYTYKWGEGEWQSIEVNANGHRYHWWTYDQGSHSSPNFKIQFDADFTNDTNYRTYNLERYRASELACWDGKVYEFKEVSHNMIDLFDAEN